MEKMAKEDAFRWARAEMFFGQGAQIRRKLLQAELDHKVETIQGYADAFNKYYGQQNMAEHAIKAAKERKSIDRGKMLKRNVGGLTTGNRSRLTPAVGTIVTAYIIAKQTGMDEPIKQEVVKQYRRAEKWVTVQRAKWELKHEK
jgi:hypothetical protein